MAENTDFYKSIPRKYVAAGALIFDDDGRVLLVKPTYKETWEIPGGVTEADESPKACCEREILEELGLSIQVSDLLCVDYVSNYSGKGDNLQLVFGGGVLSEEQVSQIRFATEELSEYRFFNSDKIDVELKEKLRLRIQKALEALQSKTTIYLENPNQD